MQGHVVRSRMQWITEREKPSRYFCALEHNNYTDKSIKCLQKQDQTYTRNETEILTELKSFYANLFKSNEDTLKDCNLEKLLKGHKVGTLNNFQAKSLKEHLTPEELSTALKNTKNNKTPGLDGFPSEVFGRI